MRVVTQKHFQRLEAVMAKVSRVCKLEEPALVNMAGEVDRLWQAGQPLEATERGGAEAARSSIVFAQLAAEVESAAIGFLGEKRRQDESLSQYVARITACFDDLGTLVATQQRNGIRWQP